MRHFPAPIETTHADFASTIAGIAAAYDERGRIADAWRGSLVEVEDHIMFIRQHRETIEQRDEMLSATTPRHRPAYVDYARKMLADRLPRYLAAVRRVSEYEIAMAAVGIGFSRAAA